SFILEELQSKYCLDHGRKAISPIRMFKYLLLKAILQMVNGKKKIYLNLIKTLIYMFVPRVI
ncbi:MAG: hypothetical protein ABS938_00735, partial [Psychrobacillus psychrodurans]